MRKKYWIKLKTLESSLPQSNSQARVRIKEHINIHVFYIFFLNFWRTYQGNKERNKMIIIKSMPWQSTTVQVTKDQLAILKKSVFKSCVLPEARLSISFRSVQNGRNIPYQFKKRNKFHLILNLGPFRIFRLNSARNIPVPFHMFRSALEKQLNQIEPYSI